MRSPHTAYSGEEEIVIDPIKVIVHHTPANSGEEREVIEKQ